MLAFELTGERFEHALGPSGVVALVRRRDRAAEVLARVLGQVVQDVAPLVDLAPLDDCALAVDRADRLRQALLPSMTKSMERSARRPREARSEISAVQTVSFSVAPS
jgi:hypothetical protein